MIAVLQRVKNASVSIEQILRSSIDTGLLIFLGVEEADNEEDVEWLSHKIVRMRIFSDNEGKMNVSLKDIGGKVLVVSQFTLHASTKKGNRPSFIKAARPDQAVPLYEKFIERINGLGVIVEAGEFGADMQISLLNDGPVTIIIDSKNRV